MFGGRRGGWPVLACPLRLPLPCCCCGPAFCTAALAGARTGDTSPSLVRCPARYASFGTSQLDDDDTSRGGSPNHISSSANNIRLTLAASVEILQCLGLAMTDSTSPLRQRGRTGRHGASETSLGLVFSDRQKPSFQASTPHFLPPSATISDSSSTCHRNANLLYDYDMVVLCSALEKSVRLLSDTTATSCSKPR